MRIAAVIAVYNRIELTKRCLNSLSLSTKKHEITPVLVDDGSTDGTEEWVKSNIAGAVVLKGDGNLWFGGATQKGFDYVADLRGQFDAVLTINNDTFLDEGALDKMVEQFAANRVVAASFWIEDRDEFGTSGFFRGKRLKTTDQSRFAEARQRAINEQQAFMKVDHVATTATLFPLEVLDASKKINLSRHPHNRYDAMLAAHLVRAGLEFFVSVEPLCRHIYGEQKRYESCKEISVKQFWTSRLKEPTDVAFLPGRIDLTLMTNQNLSVGLVNLFWLIGSFIAQAFINLLVQFFALNKGK